MESVGSRAVSEGSEDVGWFKDVTVSRSDEWEVNKDEYEMDEDGAEASGDEGEGSEVGARDNMRSRPSNLAHLLTRKLGTEPLSHVTLLVAEDEIVNRLFLLDAPQMEVDDKDEEEEEDELWPTEDPKDNLADVNFEGLQTRGENLHVELMCDVDENKDGGVNSPGRTPLALEGEGGFSGVK